MSETRLDQLQALLPQTQCGDCGYDGCRPYAEAILTDKATISKCKPGGEVVLNKIATFLSMDPTPYLDEVLTEYKPPAVAFIRKDECIGCVKCIQSCPVDAIMGGAKKLHEVIEDLCHGCGLCVPACPVDCIDMQPIDPSRHFEDHAKWSYENKKAYECKMQRMSQEKNKKLLKFQSTVAQIKSRWVDGGE